MSVGVLGWNPETKEGRFVGNLDSRSDGREFAKQLNDEGADIIFPVAGGAVELGAAALASEVGTDELTLIGVDADLYLTDPQHRGVYLTSVLKKIDATVVHVIERAIDGTFEGGVVVGTLENGGVGIAPFHSFEQAIPAGLKAELESVEKGLQNGSMKVGGNEIP